MALEPFLKPELVMARAASRSRNDLFRLLADAAAPHLGSVSADELVTLLDARERQVATATPEGIAFPHAISPSISRTLVAVATVEPGIDFGGGHPPSSIVFCLFGSSATPWEHVRLLARLARIANHAETRTRLRGCVSTNELVDVLLEEDRGHG